MLCATEYGNDQHRTLTNMTIMSLRRETSGLTVQITY